MPLSSVYLPMAQHKEKAIRGTEEYKIVKNNNELSSTKAFYLLNYWK